MRSDVDIWYVTMNFNTREVVCCESRSGHAEVSAVLHNEVNIVCSQSRITYSALSSNSALCNLELDPLIQFAGTVIHLEHVSLSDMRPHFRTGITFSMCVAEGHFRSSQR
jgi:hypothetical protein